MVGNDPRVDGLRGGRRIWWCVRRGKFVKACHVYIAFGCPDWGERGGKRNELCIFCSLPEAGRMFRSDFYDGHMTSKDHLDMFRRVLAAEDKEGVFDTIAIFNAGSFFAMPEALQNDLLQNVARHPYIRRVVVESRAELITHPVVERTKSFLEEGDLDLTVRIGVESQDDHLRQRVLKKGHKRAVLRQATEILKSHDISVGGYVLLNPAPDLDPRWALDEAKKTLEWVLGSAGLGMDEAYYCATCVGQGKSPSPLEIAWKAGRFSPASLWMVFDALKHGAEMFPGRVHMLPFQDEPPFLAVPSNHVAQGVPQDLSGATECDMEFHRVLGRYRETMDPSVLEAPECSCRPDWMYQ